MCAVPAALERAWPQAPSLLLFVRVLTSHAHLYVANPTVFGGIGEPGAIQHGHGEENPTPSN